MKRIILLLVGLLGTFAFSQTKDLQKLSEQYNTAQTDLSKRKPGWFIRGNNAVLFNQSSFNNWMAGGVNSVSLNANVDYEFNLTKGKHIWDNRAVLGYGMQANKGESTRKTNDVIDLTSAYGYGIGNNWYLGASLNFKTQFDKGWNYSSDPKEFLSNFMSPGYLSLGFGVDYKPSEDLQVNIHPITSRFTFVTDKDLQKKGKYGLKNDGDSYLYSLGAFLGARYKFNIMKDISYDNRIGIFSDYLNHPLNMEVNYQGVIDMKVNKYVSAQLALNLLYDEKQTKRTQLKQTLGVGFTYKFEHVQTAPVATEEVITIAEETAKE